MQRNSPESAGDALSLKHDSLLADIALAIAVQCGWH
jgi:hypothetical protein